MRSYEKFQPIVNLAWAKPCEAPIFPKGKKPTATQRKGIRYEAEVALELKQNWGSDLIHGQWIEYEDASGIHLCQPDFLLIEKRIIIECKLTFRPAALEKLQLLYRPLAMGIWSGEFKTLQICKNLGKYKGPTYFIDQIEEAPDGAVIYHRF